MNSKAKNIKAHLEKLPRVTSVSEITIKGNRIEHLSIHDRSLGKLTIDRLNRVDSSALFDFYFQGLSERSRNFFCPYPLFNPSPHSIEELSDTITNWEQEDDWTVLNLRKDEQIIGMCLLKRYGTKRPTSGLAIREKFQKKGLGFLLQTIINEQVCLLHLKILTITLAQDNLASLRVHEKCGFKKTGRLVPHFTYEKGVKKIDRYDIEMIKNYG